jgi:hypothetical protein
MASAVTNGEIEECLRRLLEAEGCSLSPLRSHGETGVDIIAKKESETWHIEVVGYKKVGAVRAKDFFEGFFRAVSRLNDGATYCVLALSHMAAVGLPARAKHHRVAWLRIGEAFPELNIWLVDTDTRAYRRTSWRQWAEAP